MKRRRRTERTAPDSGKGGAAKGVPAGGAGRGVPAGGPGRGVTAGGPSTAATTVMALALPLALLAGAAYSLVLARSFGFNNVDDAYIAFRYGQNLMQGHGLVFNLGDRVEGYTSFLWTLLLAPFTRARADIAWFSIPLGIAASLGTIAGVAVHARRLIAKGAHPWLAFAPLILALDNSHAFWAISGLETSLFTCLLVWSSHLVIDGVDAARAALGGLLLGLMVLTRPEGALFAGALVAWRFTQHDPRARRDAAVSAAAVAAVVVPHLLWRFAYYGDWVPNTFRVKVSLGYPSLRLGATYLGNFVMWRNAAPIVALLSLAPPEVRRRQSVYWLLVAPYLAYVFVVGGDWQVANRFMVPVLPFLILIAMDALLALVSLAPARAAALAAWGLAMIAGSYLHAESYGMVRRNDNVAVEGQRKHFGQWLHGTLEPGSLIAAGPAGAIPYYSHLPCLDMWGLTDRHIARVSASDIWPGHTRADPRYVVSRRPILIVGVAGFDSTNLPPGYMVANETIPEAVRPRDLVLLRVH